MDWSSRISFNTHALRGRRISRTACNMEYPMYCVPLSYLLTMNKVETHEVLRDRGLLEENHIMDAKPVIFISHQWVSEEHPDPDGAQLSVLQGALRQLAAGYEVRSDIMYSRALMRDEVCEDWSALLENALVWYDYMSVPQDRCNKEETKLAIQSIPAYIECASAMFILAPTIDHAELTDANGEPLLCDYYSWAKRGWCRVELFAMYLKVHAEAPIVIRSEKYMHFMSSATLATLARVAEGDFTCCTLERGDDSSCRRGKPRRSFWCDKPALFDVLRALITRRLNYEQQEGNLRFVRQLKAYSHIWLRDLRDVEEDYNANADTVENFMAHYAFTNPHEYNGGWTPLRFACISGNVDVVRQLLHEKADLEAKLTHKGDRYLPIEKGTSIFLHTIQLCCCSEHEDILALLISHKAELHPLGQMDALTAASFSMSPFKRGARWLLRSFPNWNVNQVCAGEERYGSERWPVFATLCTGPDVDFLRLLVAHKADLTLRTRITAADAFTLTCITCPTSSPDILDFIYRHATHRLEEDSAHNRCTSPGCLPGPCLDVNRRLVTPWWLRIVLNILWLGGFGPGAAVRAMLRSIGATALVLAASEGNHRMCQWLLTHNADASIANSSGETALSLAQERGFSRVVDVLSGTHADYVKRDTHSCGESIL